MTAELVERVRDRGWPDFQGTHAVLLGALDAEGTTISAAASRLGISRQAVSELARVVEDAGLIERAPHPTDRRSVTLRHTEQGRRFLADAVEVMGEIECEYAELLGDRRLADLKRTLERMLE